MAPTAPNSVLEVHPFMIDRETGLWIYNKMNEIRDFEETAWTLFTENKLRGSVHLYTGEEAVAASVCAQLTDEDYIASTHRGHGHCIAKGAELDRALAELMGKATGYCKGRSGSMHIADFSKGNLGANAIVGGGIPIATGGGLAIKMQNRKNVSVAFFGDGASNQGTFHESINLAAVWKLPVIYVCENNQFGMTVPTWQSTSVENIADRAAGYGIPGEVVDGNDVCAVYEAFARAKERALKGEGPTLLECKTYRWRGHWTGDPEPYRTREEVEEWKEKRDPIKLFRAYLTRHKLATKQELDDIEAAAAKKMEAARPQFQHGGKPDVDLVLTTQEIINMIKESGIQLPQLDLEAPDLPFGLGSGAGTIYGTTGGVAEAVVRHCMPDKSRNTLRALEYSPLRGNESIREATIPVGDREIKLAVVHGLINAQKLLKEIDEGTAYYDLIEVMTCPNGCVGGAGQPYGLKAKKQARSAGLYATDRSAPFKRAEYNPGVTSILEKLTHEQRHELLHVSYQK